MYTGRRAGWDPREQPLRGVCEWFRNPELLSEFVLQVLVEAISALHDQELMWHQEEATCLAIFRFTARRPDGRQLLRALTQQLPNVFRFEVIHQNQFRDLISRAIR